MSRRRTSFIAIVTLCLFLNLHAQVQADQLQEGLKALQDKYYTTARRLLEPLAEGGNPDAQTTIAWMYEWGLDFLPDVVSAEEWYAKAIVQGSPLAERKRAAMRARMEKLFQEGMTAFEAKDYATARQKWSDLAHEANHPAAQTNLGFLYANGFGVKREVEEARRWYRRAITLGYIPAQHNLEALEESLRARQGLAAKQRQAQEAALQTELQGRREWTSEVNKVLGTTLLVVAGVAAVGLLMRSAGLKAIGSFLAGGAGKSKTVYTTTSTIIELATFMRKMR